MLLIANNGYMLLHPNANSSNEPHELMSPLFKVHQKDKNLEIVEVAETPANVCLSF